MPFEKVGELEKIFTKIKQVNSLLSVMELVSDFNIYSDLVDIVRCMTSEQEDALRKVIEEAYDSKKTFNT